VRRHDIRALQQDLSALGLSSLGVLEPHALASLNAVIGVLEHLQGAAPGVEHPTPPPPPVDFASGPQRLREQAQELLGTEPQDRLVRIMVTMPTDAATDAQMVQDLVEAGMDVKRINCAHDGPEVWAAMVLVLTCFDAPVQGAERAADGTLITLAQVHCTLAAAFKCARPGHAVWFDDGKIGGVRLAVTDLDD
jgi:hypothetical protein